MFANDKNLIFANEMNRLKHIGKNSIIFSRWSRKNYAIFASLGKVVKIARLKTDVCILALEKSAAITNNTANLEGLHENYLFDSEENERLGELSYNYKFHLVFGLVAFLLNIFLSPYSIYYKKSLNIIQSPCFALRSAWTFFMT